MISVVGNLPQETRRHLSGLILTGTVRESKRLQLKYLELMRALFMDVNPIPVSRPCVWGSDAGECRLPCDMDSVKNGRGCRCPRDYGLVERECEGSEGGRQRGVRLRKELIILPKKKLESSSKKGSKKKPEKLRLSFTGD